MFCFSVSVLMWVTIVCTQAAHREHTGSTQAECSCSGRNSLPCQSNLIADVHLNIPHCSLVIKSYRGREAADISNRLISRSNGSENLAAEAGWLEQGDWSRVTGAGWLEQGDWSRVTGAGWLEQGEWSRVTGAGWLEQGHWSRVTGAGWLEQGHWSRVTGAGWLEQGDWSRVTGAGWLVLDVNRWLHKG